MRFFEIAFTSSYANFLPGFKLSDDWTRRSSDFSIFIKPLEIKPHTFFLQKNKKSLGDWFAEMVLRLL